MLIFSFFLVGIALVGAQTSLLQFSPSWMGSPDLVFILVAFLAYRFDWFRGLLLAIVFGWIMDVVSGLYLGTFSFLYFFLFLFLKIIKENSPVKEAAYQVPLVGVAFLVGHSGVFIFYTLALPGVLPAWSWIRIFQEMLMLVVAAIPCFVLCNSLFEYIGKRRLRLSPPRILRKRSGNYFR